MKPSTSLAAAAAVAETQGDLKVTHLGPTSQESESVTSTSPWKGRLGTLKFCCIVLAGTLSPARWGRCYHHRQMSNYLLLFKFVAGLELS